MNRWCTKEEKKNVVSFLRPKNVERNKFDVIVLLEQQKKTTVSIMLNFILPKEIFFVSPWVSLNEIEKTIFDKNLCASTAMSYTNLLC